MPRLGSKAAVSVPALADKHTITQGGNDYSETNAQILGLLDGYTGDLDITGNITASGNISGNISGWLLDSHTWTYVSADAPTYVFNINADMTSILHVGQKIKYTQDAATKYGIITAIGAYSGGNTPITIYGGGNTSSPSYAMSANAITNPYYAAVWRPLDFPINPETWTYTYDNNGGNTNSLATATWSNVGSKSIAIPIGLWKGKLKAIPLVVFSSSPNYNILYVTLSTTNNGETDTEFTGQVEGTALATSSQGLRGTITTEKIINLASKTTYYLNVRIDYGSGSINYISPSYFKGYIKAVCQYL